MKTIFGSGSRMMSALVLVLTLVGISYSCSKTDNPYDTGNPGGTGGKGSPGTNEVWIQGMAFNPSSITVKEGTTVTWTNKDATAHTVTSDANLFSSGEIGSTKTYTFKFLTAGTYPYHCSLHPSMTAKVIVTSPQTASASVSINNMTYSPSTITVTAGTVVTWTNSDSVEHTVTSDSGLFDSGAMSSPGAYTNGGTFSYTFAVAGTYPYHCTYHSAMTGKVIVN